MKTPTTLKIFLAIYLGVCILFSFSNLYVSASGTTFHDVKIAGDGEESEDLSLNDELVQLASMSENDILAGELRKQMEQTCRFHANRMANEAGNALSEQMKRQKTAEPGTVPSDHIIYHYPADWFKCLSTGYLPFAAFVKTLCVTKGFIVRCNTTDIWMTPIVNGQIGAYVNVTIILFDKNSKMAKPPCACHWIDPDAPVEPVAPVDGQVLQGQLVGKETAPTNAGSQGTAASTTNKQQPLFSKKKTKKLV